MSGNKDNVDEMEASLVDFCKRIASGEATSDELEFMTKMASIVYRKHNDELRLKLSQLHNMSTDLFLNT